MTAPELKPTDDQIESACLSYRHDFGLLGIVEQSKIKYAGLEWLRAWQKATPAFGDTQAAIAAAMTGAADKVYNGLTNMLYSETCADIAVDLIMGCVPTDTTAALEEIKRQVRDQALEEAAKKLESTWANMREIAKTIRDLKGS